MIIVFEKIENIIKFSPTISKTGCIKKLITVSETLENMRELIIQH